MYSQKTIKSLTPDWYIKLSKSEKRESQESVKQERIDMWNKKPISIPQGTMIEAKESVKSITKGGKYKVQSYFATLITTIYYSQWHEFVTLKNDFGYTVKMNLKNFKPQ